MTSMYRLPPIIPENMSFDLPTTMYKLPVIQKIALDGENVSFVRIYHENF